MRGAYGRFPVPAEWVAVMRFDDNALFLNTVLLGGTTEAKLAAAKLAGFDEIELWRQDVETADGGAAGVTSTLRRLGLGLTDYQVLLDFDGASKAMREAKRAEALRMLEGAVAVGTKTLLVPACTREDCVASHVEDDLRWLARQAARRGLRIAYEAMAWSTLNHDTQDAWKTVQNVGEDNLGMVVDAFHIFARKRTADDLKDIPAERIFLVQLSDLGHDAPLENLSETARHHRLLPGHGSFALGSLLGVLRAKNYAGPIGLEVFNDEIRALDPVRAPASAMMALRSVLGR